MCQSTSRSKDKILSVNDRVAFFSLFHSIQLTPVHYTGHVLTELTPLFSLNVSEFFVVLFSNKQDTVFNTIFSVSKMVFTVPSDLSGGLYFLNGKRTTIESTETFDVIEPRIGKYMEVTKKKF